MNQSPTSWKLAVSAKSAGGILYQLAGLQEKMFFPDVGFFLGQKNPFFPLADTVLLEFGETIYLVPGERIREDPFAFLEEGSLYLKKALDPGALEEFPILRDWNTPSFCPLCQEEDAEKLPEPSPGQLPLQLLTGMDLLFSRPKKRLLDFFRLKKLKKASELLYLPGVGEPAGYPLLAYLGAALFDSKPLQEAARQEMLFVPGGGTLPAAGAGPLCSCPACLGLLPELFSRLGLALNDEARASLEEPYFKALYHNYLVGRQQAGLLRTALKTRDFRNHVESSVAGHPELISLLRLVDRDFQTEMEPAYPLVCKHQLRADSSYSLWRPDILRYHRRLVEGFKKPAGREILLLIPCSARKPYSFSKSHKFFREAVESGVRRAQSLLKNSEKEFPQGALNFIGLLDRIHEVVITSPMGMVPRELELVSQVQSYDIPVTGDWTGEERDLVTGLLDPYLERNSYKAIIDHTPYPFVADFLKATAEGDRLYLPEERHHPTSREGQESLKNRVAEALVKLMEGGALPAPENQKMAVARSILRYQFGEAGEVLLEGSIVRGKYPYMKIFTTDSKNQLGLLQAKKGFFSLTLVGARRLHSALKGAGTRIVHIDFLPAKGGGDIFAAGIAKADPNIRSGDEVLLEKDGALVGVGVASLNGEEMITFQKGKAVKVRHWVK